MGFVGLVGLVGFVGFVGFGGGGERFLATVHLGLVRRDGRAKDAQSPSERPMISFMISFVPP